MKNMARHFGTGFGAGDSTLELFPLFTVLGSSPFLPASACPTAEPDQSFPRHGAPVVFSLLSHCTFALYQHSFLPHHSAGVLDSALDSSKSPASHFGSGVARGNCHLDDDCHVCRGCRGCLGRLCCPSGCYLVAVPCCSSVRDLVDVPAVPAFAAGPSIPRIGAAPAFSAWLLPSVFISAIAGAVSTVA